MNMEMILDWNLTELKYRGRKWKGARTGLFRDAGYRCCFWLVLRHESDIEVLYVVYDVNDGMKDPGALIRAAGEICQRPEATSCCIWYGVQLSTRSRNFSSGKIRPNAARSNTRTMMNPL